MTTRDKGISEPARKTPVVEACDVLVCGGGPAGFAAALAAARQGARTAVLEAHGQLGGVWTTGLLSVITDFENKTGIMGELMERLQACGGRAVRGDGKPTSCYDAEKMKLVLERMCMEAGVGVRLHTRVVAAIVNNAGRLTHVITESKSGREAWSAKAFVDATGDGDLAAQAGCAFTVGEPQTGATMPMTLMMLLSGIEAHEVRPFINGEGARWGVPHGALREEIRRGGREPSYIHPALWRIHDTLFALMANHQYGERFDDASAVSRATIEARAEAHAIVDALRSLGGVWKDLHIVATAGQIGVREARRVRGRYTVTAEDLRHGARFEDAICRATFCVDIHSPDPKLAIHNGGVTTVPYDIPLRALIAQDVDGLLLAGRCISGDYLAHASYRVTGNAAATGEAAGVCAALAADAGLLPHEVPAGEVTGRLHSLLV